MRAPPEARDDPTDDPSGPGDPGPGNPGSNDPNEPSDPGDPGDPVDRCLVRVCIDPVTGLEVVDEDPVDRCLAQLWIDPVSGLEVLEAGPPSDPTPPDPSPGGDDDLECERPGKGQGGVGGVDHHGDGRRIACV